MDPGQNPYSPGAGARPPALVGRDDELDQFDIAVQRLGNGLYDRSQLMTGLRGVGKTVLLNEFCSIAHRRNWAYQQIEAGEDFNMPGILAERVRLAVLGISPGQRLAERARQALGVLKSFRLRWKLPEGGSVELGVDPLPGRADTGILHDDLADLFVEVGEYAKERKVGVLFTIDEAQLLPTDQLGNLIMGLHRVSQKQLPFMVVCAGLPSLRRLTGEAKSYAERLFAFITINSLRPYDAADALTAPAKERQVEWRTDALERVVEQTSGYPYFLQEFGKWAWNAAAGPGQITLPDVEVAIPIAVEALDRAFSVSATTEPPTPNDNIWPLWHHWDRGPTPQARWPPQWAGPLRKLECNATH